MMENIGGDSEVEIGKSSEGEGHNNVEETKEAGPGPPKTPKIKCNKFSKTPIAELKKTGQSFIQDVPCTRINPHPRLGRCRECKTFGHERNGRDNVIFCRFYGFRMLKYTKNGAMIFEDFCDPQAEPKPDDLRVWLPSKESRPQDLGSELAKFLLFQLGDQFCEMVQQENEAADLYEQLHEKENADAEEVDSADDSGEQEEKQKCRIAWKRPVKDVREMCDVCETTLFNFHWVCKKCGFVVCISCFKARKNNTRNWKEAERGHDEFGWSYCSTRKHDVKNLMLTQIMPKEVLKKMNSVVHEARAKLDIPQYCCVEGRNKIVRNNQLIVEFVKGTWNMQSTNSQGQENQVACPNTSIVKDKKRYAKHSSSSEDESDEDCLALKDLFKRPKLTKCDLDSNKSEPEPQPQKSPTPISTVSTQQQTLQQHGKLLAVVPILIRTIAQTSKQYPFVKHSWLCDGKLLRLEDPSCEGNYSLFQDVWKRGQPVLVSNVADKLNKNLWSPESFSADFGSSKHDLINCMTGRIVCGQQMKTFWDGFQCIAKRLKDEHNNPMLLKLKDWPPESDFAKALPSRFQDLMNALPLKEYTQRDGKLNLAARLPAQFVRPDLGPKMYIAYGSGTHLEKGTTNLHLDISDAVNLMVYVGMPDEGLQEHNEAIYEAILDSDCDIQTLERVRQGSELPAALWHIYNARDADKIRDLINQVFLDRGIPPKPNHDPIHDQMIYLDKALRKRLKEEYNVVGYPIIQCSSDAVFIPAGAPHQVRNLQNCIKIAEDFVSPENVSHCFRLTEEFRNLSETHTNHEDKLQIKNIIYHAVKDALSILNDEVNVNINE